jgi:hypothetical protein
VSSPTKEEGQRPLEGVKKPKGSNRHNLLVKFFRTKREKEADERFIEIVDADENLVTGVKHNKFGAVCLEADKIELAETHMLKAKDILEPYFQVFTNVYMNLGNIQAQRKNYAKAI